MTSVGEFGVPQQISTGFASWLSYCSDIAHWRPTKLCAVLSCLLGWYAVYIFLGRLPPSGILPAAKFALHPSLAFSCLSSVTARHSSNGHQPNFVAWYKNGITELSQRATPIFGWAAITLGIGPHSSVTLFYCKLEVLSHLHQINRSSC